MSLPEALSDGLRAFYGAPEGLLGQLLDIARLTPQGRAGRPADALGVSARTWNAWVLGARGADGGSAPRPESRERIERASRAARVGEYGTPTKATVTAVIEWNGYRNPTEYRTVRLDHLALEPAVDMWAGGNDQGAGAAFEAAVLSRHGDIVTFDDGAAGQEVRAEFRK